LDHNGRISFIEYLLIHFKVMILAEFYKRHETNPVEDLTNDGVGIIGVGDKLLEELFEPKSGLPPELIAAIEEFTAKKREKEKKVKDLEVKAAAGGVKGSAAANELSQLEAADILITLFCFCFLPFCDNYYIDFKKIKRN
jgi:F actin bundling C terminal